MPASQGNNALMGCTGFLCDKREGSRAFDEGEAVDENCSELEADWRVALSHDSAVFLSACSCVTMVWL